MGNKRNKKLRLICTRKRLWKNGKKPEKCQKLTHLTAAIDPTSMKSDNTCSQNSGQHQNLESTYSTAQQISDNSINTIETESCLQIDSIDTIDTETCLQIDSIDTIDTETCLQIDSIDTIDTETCLQIENRSQEVDNVRVQGRRIIDIVNFYEELQKISNHSSLFNCNLNNISLVGETKNGFISRFKFKCNMCNENFVISSEKKDDKDNINVNLAAVTGITCSGIGFSQFEELTACMNIPCFSEPTYIKLQDLVYQKWEETSVESMEKAAMYERDAAIREGKITKAGMPVIDVYADGVWSSRSYGNNYKALSGAAAIVGRRSGQVIFIGIRNKYCLVCARAEKRKVSAPDHKCFKNYRGPSSGMEAEIICQGFESSVSMYGLIYGRMIADGDSATYSKIIARNPYAGLHTVEKIECKNHLLRNMCNKLRAITKETKYPLQNRKKLTDIKIMTIRKVIIYSIHQYKNEKNKTETISNFRNEVQNSIYHAFGNHENCKDFYCNKEKTVQSCMEIENSAFWLRIKTIIPSVLSKSKSLLENVDTNIVECFNSVVAKVVGGKRINFSLRRGYQARCSAAVVSFNSAYPRHGVHKKILGKSPRSSLKKFEERRLIKRKANKANPHKKNRTIKNNENTDQHDYGSQATAPDLSPDELKKAKEVFLGNLTQLATERDKIQQATINQRDCTDWFDLRRNMLTASNFGCVVKRKENSSKAKLVETIMYKSNLQSVTAVAHGIENEELALQQLQRQENVKIKPCGLYIDSEFPFLGATPDGLIEDDTVVEVKCPIVAYKNGLENSIKENKIQIWKYDKKTGIISINCNSNWYYQIQGQLHITRKQKCLFGAWSGENHVIKTEIIYKDDNFWDTKMKNKLLNFYMDWLLPEIVDPRRIRGMSLRELEKQSNQVDRKRKSTSQIDSESPIKRLTPQEVVKRNLITPVPKEITPCCSRQLTFEEL